MTMQTLPSVISLPQVIARNWWRFLLRGVAALIVGVLSLVWPGISLATLILLFGVYALVDGAFAQGLRPRQSGRVGCSQADYSSFDCVNGFILEPACWRTYRL